MDKKDFIEKLKTINPKDYIYPGIFLLFISIVTILLFIVATSLSSTINKIFSFGESANVQGLDIENYELVARKLNISVPTTAENVITTSEESITPEEVIATSTEPLALNKKGISLNVTNSTTKSGLAGSLAQKLENAGYNRPSTTTDKKLRATTTLIIKPSKEAYVEEILDIVRVSYPDVIVATTTETASVDAMIIIGTH